MSIDIVVPDLGESVTEATVARWLKATGDAVQADEPVVELETDKATLELGAPKAGVLGKIVVAEGEDVEVGALLAHLEEGDGSVTTAAPTPAPAAESSPAESSSHDDVAAPAAAKTPATQTARGGDALEPPDVKGSGEGGAIGRADLEAALGLALDQQGPAVRALLEQHGLDPARIPASGRNGRLTKGDVLAFAEAGGSDAARTQATAPTGGTRAETAARTDAAPREERVRMTRMRRTIAARLKEAQQTAAILTTFNEVDMSAVMALRKKHKEDFEKKHGVRLGFTSFFAKACVAALQAVPSVNAELDGEEIVYKHYYDLGMAVASPNGLVVPIIRDCDSRSFAQIESELARLAGRAQDGSLTNEEMAGGTFSISNGGVFGSMLSTPILNRPQSAILGLHKIEDRPVALDGEVVIRPMMYVAVSYDHRLIDGREAVTFLVAIKNAIEDPQRLLLDL